MGDASIAAMKSDVMHSFFESYFRRRPVNAGFIGIHHYDDLLPDFSENGIADTVTEMESLRLKFTGHSIDEELARNFLDVQIEEFRGNHFHRSNPALYT